MLIIYVMLPSKFWINAINIDVKSGKREKCLLATTDKFSRTSTHTIAVLVAFAIYWVVLKRLSFHDP